MEVNNEPEYYVRAYMEEEEVLDGDIIIDDEELEYGVGDD